MSTLISSDVVVYTHTHTHTHDNDYLLLLLFQNEMVVENVWVFFFRFRGNLGPAKVVYGWELPGWMICNLQLDAK